MARITGVDLPKDKRVEVGLTYIYGIGRSQSLRILGESQINPDTRVKNLTEEELGRLNAVISKGHKVEGAVRQEIDTNIKRLVDIGCYRGFRHRKGLPVRGQRTKTNARTRKGPRKTVGIMRKKSMQKTAGKAGK